MTAIEDPGPSSEAAGPNRPNDDLEDWLSDLRTEVAADPPGWIDKHPGTKPPAADRVERSPQAEPNAGGGGGRHRAAD
jgi:hypothetical protein